MFILYRNKTLYKESCLQKLAITTYYSASKEFTTKTNQYIVLNKLIIQKLHPLTNLKHP